MEQVTNNKVIKLAGDDIPYISIPESEYDHLVQCKQELLLLKQRKNAEMQSFINNYAQEAALNQLTICQQINKL